MTISRKWSEVLMHSASLSVLPLAPAEEDGAAWGDSTVAQAEGRATSCRRVRSSTSQGAVAGSGTLRPKELWQGPELWQGRELYVPRSCGRVRSFTSQGAGAASCGIDCAAASRAAWHWPCVMALAVRHGTNRTGTLRRAPFSACRSCRSWRLVRIRLGRRGGASSGAAWVRPPAGSRGWP